MPMNMVMKKSTRIKITQSYQDDCCDGWKNSGKGVKSMRRRVKRMEKRQWLREQD